MKVRKYSVILVMVLWAGLTAAAWFGSRREISDFERRPLAQMPTISLSSVFQGRFMEQFGDYSLDQFPMRDGFRTLKALFHAHVLGQKDNNDIYIVEGYAAKQEYPLNEASLRHAADRFQYVYEKYLTDSAVYMAIVPDKGQYLAEGSGHLSLELEDMDAILREEMPWATHISLYDALGYDDYYRTDTHWRQEKLFEAAKVLCDALGVAARTRQTIP